MGQAAKAAQATLCACGGDVQSNFHVCKIGQAPYVCEVCGQLYDRYFNPHDCKNGEND